MLPPPAQPQQDVLSEMIGEVMGIMEARLSKEGPAAPFTLPADAVTGKVIKILESDKPDPRYFVTFPTHLFGFLKRILPTRGVDWIIKSAE